jgi:hypothetical protein
VVSCFEDCNELTGFVKSMGLLDRLNDQEALHQGTIKLVVCFSVMALFEGGGVMSKTPSTIIDSRSHESISEISGSRGIE